MKASMKGGIKMKLSQRQKREITFWANKAQKVIDYWRDHPGDPVAADILASKLRETSVYINRCLKDSEVGKQASE